MVIEELTNILKVNSIFGFFISTWQRTDPHTDRTFVNCKFAMIPFIDYDKIETALRRFSKKWICWSSFVDHSMEMINKKNKHFELEIVGNSMIIFGTLLEKYAGGKHTKLIVLQIQMVKISSIWPISQSECSIFVCIFHQYKPKLLFFIHTD